MGLGGLFLVFGGNRVVNHVCFALAKLEPVALLCERSLRRQPASLRLREHVGAEAFAGLHLYS
jgi:hypothetical protein